MGSKARYRAFASKVKLCRSVFLGLEPSPPFHIQSQISTALSRLPYTLFCGIIWAICMDTSQFAVPTQVIRMVYQYCTGPVYQRRTGMAWSPSHTDCVHVWHLAWSFGLNVLDHVIVHPGNCVLSSWISWSPVMLYGDSLTNVRRAVGDWWTAPRCHADIDWWRCYDSGTGCNLMRGQCGKRRNELAIGVK